MTTETREFGAKVDKILQLMIHSIYAHKEIFLRELISNAYDACDKLRYLAVSRQDLIPTDGEPFKITISLDKEQSTLIVQDNGIGMNKQDLIDNLGTIARSGTEAFIEQLSNDGKKDLSLIGQFGIGFYSAYMVADFVTVRSRKAGEDITYQWSSSGSGTYEVQESEQQLQRGTQVILKIKDQQFLDHFRLKTIIKNYSDHIAIPIFFIVDGGIAQQVNSSSALWTRPKSEISADQYKEFYCSIAHTVEEPWLTIHNKNEGAIEFTNLVFVPQNKTFDLFHPDRKRRVKLYVKRVFISEENINLIPAYLRFLRGIVDCEDLPLNINRETLQHNALIDKMRASITNRVLGELKKQKESNREDYEKFWVNFGAVVKEGLCEPGEDHKSILDLCLFKSALHHKMISLNEYVANFKEGQKAIYYLSGDEENKLRNSPQIEGLLDKGVDVLLFTDHVDDFWVNVGSRYEEYDIQSATRANLDVENITDKESSEKPNEEQSEEYKTLCAYFKDTLGMLIKDVRISKKLILSPVCLVVDAGEMDIRMERFLLEQKQLAKATAKTLEINPQHPIIAKINDNLNQGNQDQEVNADLVKVLFAEACIAEGEPIHDVSDFRNTLNKLLTRI